jgi:hypothetical protein
MHVTIVRTHVPNVLTVRTLKHARALSTRTELVVPSLPAAWARQYGHLVDRVTFPLLSHEGWLDLVSSVAAARAARIDVALETRIMAGEGRGGMKLGKLAMSIDPSMWSVILESPDDLEPFIIRNEAALSAMAEVRFEVPIRGRAHYRFLD